MENFTSPTPANLSAESARVVTEMERQAVEVAMQERLGANAPTAILNKGGGSPYSPVSIVFLGQGAEIRGSRVGVAPVVRSHNGAGNYKGRGRWRTVFLSVTNPKGEWAVCGAGDRDAQQVGVSGYYVRPWASHEAEEKSRGMGMGAEAMASAFAALGL